MGPMGMLGMFMVERPPPPKDMPPPIPMVAPPPPPPPIDDELRNSLMTVARTSGAIVGSWVISSVMACTSSGPSSLKSCADISGGKVMNKTAAFCLGVS
jgi:hypothetical protein